MNAWAGYWLTWFLVTITTFAVPETYALVTGHPENTLSAQIWGLEGILSGQEPIWQWTAAHILIGGSLFLGLVWLAFHLLFGIWRG